MAVLENNAKLVIDLGIKCVKINRDSRHGAYKAKNSGCNTARAYKCHECKQYNEHKVNLLHFLLSSFPLLTHIS